MDIVDVRTPNLTEAEINVIQAAANWMALEQTADPLGLTSIVACPHRYRARWKTGAMDMCGLVIDSIYAGWITVLDGTVLMSAEDESSATVNALDSSEAEDAAFGCPLGGGRLEVTRALATGLPIAEIAEILNLSGVTVRNHIQRARDAVESPNKFGLVATAISEGWITPLPTRSTGIVSIGASQAESWRILYIALGSAA